MDGKINVLIRGKSELTKKRHQVDVLLKRAMKGNHQSKEKLNKEFGIKVYSTDEVAKYVKEKLKNEVIEESPLRVKSAGSKFGQKNGIKALQKRKVKLVGKRV
jgi:Glu-tRNA(Gln) amidotransferase subunit E-like FAD-binding protein